MNRNEIKLLLDNPSLDASLLLLHEEDQQAWWSMVRQSESYRPMVDEVREEAEKLLRQQDPERSFTLFRIFAESGTRLEYERVYFEMRKRLNTFAIMTLLEPERSDYLQALEETIWSICNEYTWCLPAHVGNTPETTGESSYSLQVPSADLQGNAHIIDLFSAETGFALSEVLRLTEHKLPRLLRNRIIHELYRRIFWPYIHQGPFHWEKATHNWAAVCAGSIGAAALHLMKNEEDLAAILEKVLGTMNCYLKGFEEDGATTEGYGYWYYGFGFFVFFADLLKKRTAGSINLFSDEKIHRIALFQQKCFMSGTAVVNFSDSTPEARIHMGLTHYLNRIYPDVVIPDFSLRTSYTEDHCNRWATALRNILWFREEKAITGGPWDTASYYLKDAQWLVSRYVNENGTYCFAAKGGHNNEPHNHNDVGQFIVHSQGQTFLADLGCGMYTKEYFGPERYTYLCNSSRGHSVPILNGRLQQPGSDHRATDLQVTTEANMEKMQLDLSGAYDEPQLRHLVRSFTWTKKELPQLLLLDTFDFTEAPTEIVERFITMIEPTFSGDDLYIAGAEQRLHIRFDSALLQPHIEKLEYTDHFGAVKVVYAIDFKLLQLEQQCSAQFIFEFKTV
ncbi:heparinase II/III family protein [Paenibacillus sp. UNC451MF]|uniref:heparinase II/III family protein n=1 Tax=Paenibacillus sp. UNC451MF TaxID=1449063 RepID=UPI00048D2368|nr:heparinase II/III family protein [Paenibacillus sp. UNC451MF]